MAVQRLPSPANPSLGRLRAPVPVHGQSINLSALALVASDPNLPTSAAIRWFFRYELGLPPLGATLYRRQSLPKAPLVTVDFRNQQSVHESGWIDLGEVRVRSFTPNSPTTIVTGKGLLVDGLLAIQLARPFVEARPFGALGDSTKTFEAVALHSLLPLDSASGPQPTVNTELARLRADIIDVVLVLATGPMFLTGIELLPLEWAAWSEDVAWQKVMDVPMPVLAADAQPVSISTLQPFNRRPGLTLTPVFSQLDSALRGLFDPTIVDSQGDIVPMGERSLGAQSSQTGQAVTLPTLLFLLLGAFGPALARELGLLVDVSSPGAANAGEWDYLLVGHWNPRAPLGAGASRADFTAATWIGSGMAQVGTLLISSSSPLSPPANGGGLDIAGVVWVYFPSPVQVVEIEFSGAGLEVTAFGAADGTTGMMPIGDWSAGNSGPLTVCADAITAVTLRGPGAVVTAVISIETDPALEGAVTAAVGDIGYWMFAARSHAAPTAPEGVETGTLPNPSGAPGLVNVGIRWEPEEIQEFLQVLTSNRDPYFGPLAHQVYRGPTQAACTQAVAGVAAPFVVPYDPADADATVLDAYQSSPWYLLDPVQSGTQLVYGVMAVDVFGRASTLATATASTFADVSPPPPPINLAAAVQADGTVALTWQWPAPPPAPPDQAGLTVPAQQQPGPITGFRVYFKSGSLSRSSVAGSVTSLTTNTSDGTFTVAIAIYPANTINSASVLSSYASSLVDSSGNPDTSAYTQAIVRIGGDSFVVHQATVTAPLPIGAAQQSSPAALQLTLFRNPSTPTLLPSVGNNARIPIPGDPVPGAPTSSLYDGHLDFQGASLLSATVAVPGDVQWPPLDERGMQALNFGVSALNGTLESSLTGPAVARQISTTVADPPVPATTNTADIFTTPPNAHGMTSYVYTAAAAPSSSYYVYRALDDKLFVVDQENPYRTNGVWDPSTSPPALVLGPLSQADFDAVTLASPPSVPSLSNTDLMALANLPGNEAAFEQMTSTPVTTGPSDSTINFADSALRGVGTSRYIYRLRSVAASGAQGGFGWAGPPVTIYPQPPVRVTLVSVRSRGSILDITWTLSAEPEVTSYRLYLATDATSASDERLMTLATELPASVYNPDSGVPTQSASVNVNQGNRYWVRVTAVAHYDSPLNTDLVSLPSDPIAATPVTLVGSTPPQQATVQASAGQIQVSFTADLNPTTQYMLLRSLSSVSASVAVTAWSQPVAPGSTVILTDPDPPSAAAQYVIACTNASGRTTRSAPFPYVPAPGA